MKSESTLSQSYLPCKWRKGLFSSERIVEFEIDDRSYSTIVGDRDVVPESNEMDAEGMRKGLLRVYVVGKEGSSLLVDLPRETPVGIRFFVPPNLLRQSV